MLEKLAAIVNARRAFDTLIERERETAADYEDMLSQLRRGL